MEKEGDAKGMVAMKPLETGGFEAALYRNISLFGDTHKGIVSVISYGTVDGGYLQ